MLGHLRRRRTQRSSATPICKHEIILCYSVLGASSLDFQPGWIDQIERIQEERLGEEL